MSDMVIQESISKKEFQEVLEENLNSLLGHAMTLTRNRAEAEDLVQETSLKAFRAYENQFEKGTNMRAWLFTILRNTFVNEYRKKKKAGYSVPIEDFTEYSFFGEAAQQAKLSPEKFISPDDINSSQLDEILGDEVVNAMDTLPDDFRESIFLRDVKDLSYQEISEVMHVPIGTVRSRLARARGMLNKLLWDYAQEKGILRKKS